MQTENLLIEIGCEELPPWVGEHFISRFKPLFLENLVSDKIGPCEIKFFFTPRRLVIFVKNLSLRVPGEKKEIKGPRYEQAFDEKGRPTHVAHGFAKAHNVQISALKVKEFNGKKIVYLIKTTPPVSTSSIIAKIVPAILKKLEVPRGMRWNESGEIFYRPIRWIFSIFGTRKVDIEFAGVKSSPYTFGHRVLCPQKMRISNWCDYFGKLQKGFVIVDEELREKFALGLIEKSLERNDTVDKSIVRNITNLVEYPCVIRCRLPEIECDLPEEVLRVLIQKVKGIPIFNGGHLKKEFFVISDGNSNENIRTNYENLLKTRIFDAQFFYNSDISIPFESMAEKLDRIVFHQKWGSVARRVKRLKEILTEVSELFELGADEKSVLLRATLLCKNDLASQMVKEFPELHGIIGAIYARRAGENEKVCSVISQYKYPVYPGDSLPDNKCACILGIIDRLDFIIGFITAGIDVSGSEDPYGLKRTTAGLFALVDNFGIELDYEVIIDSIINSYHINENVKKIKDSIIEFLLQRFEAYLESDNYPKGLRASVISIDKLNFVRVRRKLDAIRVFIRNTGDADIILIPVSRVANILKQASEKGIQFSKFDEKLLEEKAEKNLAVLYRQFLEKADKILEKKNYSEFLKNLSHLKQPIDEFFDNVLVMCPDERLRKNRLSLLKMFNNIFLKFADFSYIREEDIKNVRKN